MPTKKKATIVQAKEAPKPDAPLQDAIIRNLIAIIRTLAPERTFTAVSQAERYLATKEDK